MGINSSSFSTDQMIRGTRFYVDSSNKFSIIGYYISPSGEGSTPIFKRLMKEPPPPVEGDCTHIVNVKNTDGYYLNNIVSDNKDGKETIITLQFINNLGDIKPIVFKSAAPDTTDATTAGAALDATTVTAGGFSINNKHICDRRQNISNISVVNDTIEYGCSDNEDATYIKGVENIYLYIFILIILTIIMLAIGGLHPPTPPPILGSVGGESSINGV